MENDPFNIDNLERAPFFKGLPFESLAWQIKGTTTVHHPYQPAIQYKNGSWSWFWMGHPHRWDGPAIFWNRAYGYWIHGTELSYDEWLGDPQRLEWLKANKLDGV